MQALVVDEGRVGEDIVEQTYSEAFVGSAAEVVVDSVEGIAAELDAKASDVVGFAVVEAMAEVVCISESECAHWRLQGKLGPAYSPAGSDAAVVELWSSAEAEEYRRCFLVTAVVTGELAHVVGVAEVAHRYDFELV